MSRNEDSLSWDDGPVGRRFEAKLRYMPHRWLPVVAVSLAISAFGARAGAQTVRAARVNVLAAEDRRAPTLRDLTILRTATRGRDPETARIAVRALGRLERPDLIPDIVPALRHALPEVRSEAANAIAQAARGWAAAAPAAAGKKTGPATSVTSVQAALIARLEDEEEASVRAAICESLGRLPYRTVEQVDLAEATLVEQLELSETITDRLGVAKAFEAFVRVSRGVRPASASLLDAIRSLVSIANLEEIPAARFRPEIDPIRDARVRRLALEALLAASAVDGDSVARAETDPDQQVRRLAMKAAMELKSSGPGQASFVRGLEDPSPMVRLEALRGIRERGGDQTCAVSLAALGDPDAHVALLALDQLASCGTWRDGVTRLEHAIHDLSAAGSPRGWHRAAHASVALALAAPDRASATLGQLTGSSIWQLRMYAARAATILKDRERLEQLAQDGNDNVAEAAMEGLRAVAGHDSDASFVAALSRRGYQAVRMAALALDGSPNVDVAVPALKEALQRLTTEGRANSLDARRALAETLTRLGSPTQAPVAPKPVATTVLNGEDLRRLASPRARITIAGVGIFELALFTAEAPATVLQFADLAESGYYNGLTFHRVLANFVIQGGSPDANEYVGHPDYMRDEVGLWPHVRGAVGISTRGRDTGDAQIFIDLVDNPRLDHQYTVFAQVLNGMDVVDRILEGDAIEKIEILP
jgi:cyclophilin family peptidyl-prolyl cis-trans isomerase